MTDEERKLVETYVAACREASAAFNQAAAWQAKAMAAAELRDEALKQYVAYMMEHGGYRPVPPDMWKPPETEQEPESTEPEPAVVEADPNLLSPMAPTWP